MAHSDHDGRPTGISGHRPIGIAWKPPPPRGMPRLRAAVADLVQSPAELDRMAHCVTTGRTLRIQGVGNFETATTILAEEHSRLASAALYYATRDMTQLAVAAARSLPDFELEPEDVPAPAGFIVFADPTHHYDEPGNDVCPPLRVPIVAMSWGPSELFSTEGLGVWITFWSPWNLDFHAALDRHTNLPHTPDRRRILQERFAPLQWDNEVLWRFGASWSAVQGRKLATGPPMQVLRTAWLLMQQPQLLDPVDIERPRAEYKHDVRQGLSSTPVRVLQLRAARRGIGAPQSESADRQRHCRWLVTGHWRQQWYPARGVHRPVWIAPYVKGPADKPLKTTETVHLWNR